MPPAPFDADLMLRRHGGALRALARVLLRDANDADDAVQETWHRVLRSPPRHGARLDAWFTQVLRNVVRRLRRGELRRRRREGDAARLPPQAVGDEHAGHAEHAERTETARTLLAALDRLDAPYRDVLWRRYFEGLPPRAIARATGEPVATVKSRLQRGLATLRAQLAVGGRGGGRSSWRGATALAFGLADVPVVAAAPAAVPALALGGVLVATWSKVTVAAALAAAVFVVWWRAPGAPDVPPGGAPAPAPAAAVVAGAAHVDPPAREAIAGASHEPAPAAAASADAAAPPARRRGRVVDAATGAPLPGAVVTLGYRMGLQPEPGDERQTTAADGRFEFVFPAVAAREPRLWVECPGYVRVWWSGSPVAAGQLDDIGDVPVRAGRRLAGRVLDARGAPVPAGARVEASYVPAAPAGAWRDSAQLAATTRADGTFVLEPAVGLGTVCFALRSDQHTLAAPMAVEVDALTPVEVELVAAPRPVIDGVVVGEDGAPLAGIAVGTIPEQCDARTDAGGRFRLRWRDDHPLQCDLYVADAPDHVPPPPRRVAWNGPPVRIELARAAVVALSVVDDRGAPVERFGVVLHRNGIAGAARGTVRSRGTHAGGRLDVRGVAPGATSLRVMPVDPSLTPSELLPVAGAEPMRVVLSRRRTVAVEVRCAGRPLTGVLVETTFAEPDRPTAAGRLELLDPHAAATAWLPEGEPERIAAARTGADGVARLLADAATASRWLRVHAGGHAPFVVREPGFPVDGSPLRVDVPGAGTLAGRVALHGRSRESVAVIAQRGPDERLVARPQPDGTFRWDGLTAGSWNVELVLAGPLPESRRAVDVRHAETTELTFDLAAFAPAAVDGRLLLAGEPFGEASVQLWRIGVQQRPELLRVAQLGADGRFTAEDLLPGSYRLAVKGPDVLVPGLGAQTFVLAAGERLALQQPFARRRLVVRLQRADGTPVRQEQVVARCDGVQWPSFAMFAPKVDDVLVFDPAPALPIELRRLASTGWSPPFVMPQDRSEAELTVVLR